MTYCLWRQYLMPFLLQFIMIKINTFITNGILYIVGCRLCCFYPEINIVVKPLVYFIFHIMVCYFSTESNIFLHSKIMRNICLKSTPLTKFLSVYNFNFISKYNFILMSWTSLSMFYFIFNVYWFEEYNEHLYFKLKCS